MGTKFMFRKPEDCVQCPDRTLRNIILWTSPIHVYRGGKIGTARPRIFKSTFGTRNSKAIAFRTTKYRGETHDDIPLSNYYMVVWFGWMWGWKV